jgi:hypothetical protein
VRKRSIGMLFFLIEIERVDMSPADGSAGGLI